MVNMTEKLENKLWEEQNGLKYFKPIIMTTKHFNYFYENIVGNEDNFPDLTSFPLLEATFYDGCFFRITFLLSQDKFLTGFHLLDNYQDRIDLLKKLYPQENEFFIQFNIGYNPIRERNACPKNIDISLDYLSENEFNTYCLNAPESTEYDENTYCAYEAGDILEGVESDNHGNDEFVNKVFIEGNGWFDKLEFIANVLYFKKTGKTIYEEMAEDDLTDCDFIENICDANFSDVNRLKRLHRQTLDFFNEIKLKKYFSNNS